MFKNKIALKLFLYFTVSLLVFSIIIGSVFAVLFKKHTIQVHKIELEKRAASIAQTLSGFMSVNDGTRGMGMGYGAYLQFLDDIAMADIWIVDQNLGLITRGQGRAGFVNQYVYADLPPDAEQVISEVFTGKTAFSEDFSTLIKVPTLTVGTPILTNNGDIIGVVLLHSPVAGINQAVSEGYITLSLSILAALIIAIILSIGLSITFTRPLNKMKSTAMLIADGDYTAKTNVQQNNEIGSLAVSIDSISDRLYQASKESEKLEQLRRDFVANISHELRTPVTVIRGSIEALCDEVVTDPEQIKSYQRQVLLEALYLQRLVGDLLDLSKLQNTAFEIEKQDINIADVIDEVVRSMTHIANEKGVRIEVRKNKSPEYFHGDYGRLRQIIMILLDNALKFSPPGGLVKLCYENRRLSITDHGIGIPEEDLPYIFDRFYKSRSEQNKSGTGLGLAIAKQICDRHGIEITAASQPDIKTEFCLNFAAQENRR
jgi:signal transduction histidine kinase